MNKMDGLRAGIAEMRSVARRLMAWADDLEKSFQDREAGKPEMVAAGPVQPEGGKKAAKGKAAGTGVETLPGAGEKKALTLPEVRAVLAGKCAAGYGTQVKALIESYGAATLKDVPAEKYEELLEAAAALGEGMEVDADAG